MSAIARASILLPTLCSLTAGAEPDRLTVRFAPSCYIADAIFADSRWILLVKGYGPWFSGTVVYLDVATRQILDIDGQIEPWMVAAVSKTTSGRLVTATKLPVANELSIQVPGSRELRRLKLLEGEQLIGFATSKTSVFLTTHRVGSVDGTHQDAFLEQPLHPRSHMYFDSDGSSLLLGWPPTQSSVAPPEPGQLMRIDVNSGKSANIPIDSCDLTSAGNPPGEIHSHTSMIFSGIVADTTIEGACYIGIGGLTGSGYLIHILSDNTCSVVFEKRSPKLLGISGVQSSLVKLSEDANEPVLSLAKDSRGILAWITPYGIYQMGGDKSTRFVGATEFDEWGNVYISSNIPGFLAILTQLQDKIQRPGYPARVSKLYLLAGPP